LRKLDLEEDIVDKRWKITFMANGYDFTFEVQATSKEAATERGSNILGTAFPSEGHEFEITSVQQLD
jgi:hypothetical protein